MVQPAYAQLGMDVMLSYRPNEDKISSWHAVRMRNGRIDNLQSIAEEYEVPVATLIEFNFPGSTKNGRVDPGIVNWYLHNHRDFRCMHATADGNNYLFKGGRKGRHPVSWHSGDRNPHSAR
jgi:hypothetical protein